MDIQELLLGGATTPTHAPENLGEITELAQLLIDRQAIVAEAEKALSVAKADLRKIEEEFLPEAMKSLNLEEIKLQDGSNLKVEDFYKAHITDASHLDAFEWLRGNDHGDLIKKEVGFSFGKGQDEVADEFIKMVRQWNGDKGTMKVKEGVHHSTLNAFVKQEKEAGRDLPESISVYEGHRVKIKAPKKR